jgi:hypothetical protein
MKHPNYLSERYTLPDKFREKPALDKVPFANKRGSLKKALERRGVQDYDELLRLSEKDLRDLKEEIEFFEKNPDATDEQIEGYFRHKSKAYGSIADRVSKEGKNALRSFKQELPKHRPS